MLKIMIRHSCLLKECLALEILATLASPVIGQFYAVKLVTGIYTQFWTLRKLLLVFHCTSLAVATSTFTRNRDVFMHEYEPRHFLIKTAYNSLSCAYVGCQESFGLSFNVSY